MSSPSPTQIDPLDVELARQRVAIRRGIVIGLLIVLFGGAALLWKIGQDFNDGAQRYFNLSRQVNGVRSFMHLTAVNGHFPSQSEWMNCKRCKSWRPGFLYIAPEQLDALGARPRFFAFLLLNLGYDNEAGTHDDGILLTVEPKRQLR